MAIVGSLSLKSEPPANPVKFKALDGHSFTFDLIDLVLFDE
jgi:hypothetical protein